MSNLFFQPRIFEPFSEVEAFHSLRYEAYPAAFSMRDSNTTPEIAAKNREQLVRPLGFTPDRIASPKQVHSDTVIELPDKYKYDQRPEGDAIMTDKPGWVLGVMVADCVAVLLFDPKHQALAATHSGWRGSAKNIAGKTVAAMQARYASAPSELRAFLSPAPNRYDYPVGPEVAGQFEPKYSSPQGASAHHSDGAYLDNKLIVHDQLLAAGLKPEHIEIDPRSTINDTQFFSHRREGDKAGRMLVAIALKERA